MVRARSMQMQIAEESWASSHTSAVKLCVPAATKIRSTALLLTAAVSSATVLTKTSLRCRPCSTRGATLEGVFLMTGPERVLATIGVLATIVNGAPGKLGALGGPLLFARMDAPQLPSPARMMMHITWSRAHFDDALLPRETVGERHECAQRLNDPTLAAPATTATPTKNVAVV
eukprot:scaffold16691_cov74-Phaeocystis_antarctica.AAC.7